MIFWPIITTVNPRAIGEPSLGVLFWGVIFVLALLGLIKWALTLFGRGWKSAPLPESGAARMLVIFIFVSFYAWTLLFSIHRYLIAPELIAPLVLWVLALSVLPQRIAHWGAALMVCACVIYGF